MEQEDKRKLERLLDISEENNKILKTLLRNMRWGRLLRIIYWGLIIAASVGAFYYFQPLIDELSGAYGAFQGEVGKVNSLFGR
jgi:hypothetical protein